ncbi:MAG: hypothetical protein MJ064_08835 [Lachnospiraceae bacterium]|nr:hypothetical protein [Lachnospiraceae bacterium]
MIITTSIDGLGCVDSFAANYLISPASLRKFSPTKYASDADIIAFAESIGVHPGIMARF